MITNEEELATKINGKFAQLQHRRISSLKGFDLQNETNYLLKDNDFRHTQHFNTQEDALYQ